jgi:urease accessory protein UreF
MSTDALGELAALIAASGLSGKRKTELTRKLDSARMNIGRNLDYVAERFDEHMERTVEKAKSEVNAYAHHIQFGLAALALQSGAEPPILMLNTPEEETPDD